LQSITDRGAETSNAVAISNATGSTGSGNGALTVTGGVGVGENLNVAGSMNVKGPVVFSDYVSFNGTSTYVYSTNTYYTDNIVELHVHPSGVDTEWEIGDGKDIGFRLHYYNRTLATGTNAALVLADDTQMLEWYQSGVEQNGVFTSSAVYGAFKLGTIHLVDTTENLQNATSGALQIAGGLGIAKTQWIGGTGGVGAITATLQQSLVVNSGGLGVNGDSYFANNVGINGNTTIGGNQLLTGNATVGGNLEVTGVSTLTDNVFANADLTVIGPSTLTGNVTAQSDLGVAGNFNVTGTSVLTGDVTTTNNLSVGANVQVTGVSTFSGITYFKNTTESAGTDSGAVLIEGGIGIGGSVNVAGNMFVQGTINAQIIGVISTASNLAAGATGAIPYQTGYGQTSFLNPGAAGTILTSNGSGAIPAYQNTLTLAGTTESTSTDSGAFITLGGVGVGKNLWVGGDIYTLGQQVITTATVNNWSNQTAVFAGTDTAVSTSTGNITVWNTSTLDSVMQRGGTSQYQLVITNETPSTSTATGALLVTNGGVGIAGDLYVGEDVNIAGSLTIGASVVGATTSTFDYLVLQGTGTALSVTTNAVITGNLTATTLNVTGRSTLSDITADSSTLTSLTVINNILTGGNVGVNQNFNVTGTSVLTGDVYANANVSINGNLFTTGTSVTIGNTYLDSDLNVKGNVFTTGTSAVIGDSYVDSNLGVKGNFNVTGTTTVSGLLSGGSAVLSGSLGVTGTTTLSGSVNIGPVSQHISFQSPSTSTTATITLDSFTATVYQSAKYFVQAVDSGVTPNKVHVAELVVFHDNNGAGTIPYVIQYGIGSNTGELGSWGVVYNTGEIVLQFTPNYIPTDLVVKTARTTITT
jgi:predicted acyltransferase (DUF342 family)